jgi:prepilin-type processing-associated H-X9-DG protein
VIEDGKILKTKFRTGTVSIGRIPRSCSARADPIGHAIGGKPIIIPANIAFSDGHALELPILLGPQAAIAPPSLRDLATIDTNLTE